MKALQVRELTSEEYEALQMGVRSASAFTVRRCQIVLMSAEEGLKAVEIGRRLGCSAQCVRHALPAFEAEGLTCLQEKSRARKRINSPDADYAGKKSAATG